MNLGNPASKMHDISGVSIRLHCWLSDIPLHFNSLLYILCSEVTECFVSSFVSPTVNAMSLATVSIRFPRPWKIGS